MAGLSAMVEMLYVDGGESNLGWHFGAWNWSSSLGLAEKVLGSTIQGGFDHGFGYGRGMWQYWWCEVGVGAGTTGWSKAKKR